MRKRSWSVARMMVDIAILAVGLTSFLALRSRQDGDNSGVGVLGFVLALVLTVVTDRALFGRRHRSFWLGFTAAAWLCAAMALSHLQQTRRYLLEYGPPVVRAREDFIRQHVAARLAELRGVAVAKPQVSEWYLLCSLLVELSLGLILGGLAASAGGLFTAAVAFIARQANHPARQGNER
jgi:MFS family permease